MTKEQVITRIKHNSMYQDDRETAEYIIQALEERKQGEWIRVINELNATHKCSNCGLGVNSKYINYCPQCGSHNFNGNEGVDNG